MPSCNLCGAGPGGTGLMAASCCDSPACQSCAREYTARTGRCWAVDCGTPCGPGDLLPSPAPASPSSNQSSPAAPPVGTVRTDHAPAVPPAALLCSLCATMYRRAVTTPCCGARACRSCAVKFITAKKRCWGRSCLNSNIRTAALRNDRVAREAIKMLQQSGKVSAHLLAGLQGKRVTAAEVDKELAGESVGERLAEMNVSVVTETTSDSSQNCDTSAKLNSCDEDEHLRANSKRNVDSHSKAESKKSKFDQICTTVDETQLLPKFPNYILAKLSLQEHWKFVKVVFAKQFLKFLLANEIQVERSCLSQKCEVLKSGEEYYIFIEISLRVNENKKKYLLARDFHLANFSKFFSTAKKEEDLIQSFIEPISLRMENAVTVEDTPKICKVVLTIPAGKTGDIPPLYLLNCSNKEVIIVNRVIKPVASYRLANESKEFKTATAQLLVKSSSGKKVYCFAGALIGEVSVDSNIDQLVNEKNNDDCDINGEKWFENLDVPTRQKLAETKKLEGNSLFSKRSFLQAIRKYSAAIELDGSHASFYSNRAACFINVEDYSNALDDALKSVELDPKYAKGFMRAAKCFIFLGQVAKAKEMCSKVIEISNNLAPLVEEENEKIKQIENSTAEFLKSNSEGNISNALHHLDMIAAICPKFEKIHLLRAELLTKKGEFAKCKEILQQNFNDSSLMTDDIEVLYIKALLFYYEDKYEDACLTFKAVLTLDPTHEGSKQCLDIAVNINRKKEDGNANFKEGKYEEALVLYTEALKIDKFNFTVNAKLLCNRAITNYKLGKVSESIDDFSKAIHTDKTYQKPYFKRGQAYMEIESFEEAVKDFEQLVKMDSKNKEYASLLVNAKQKFKESKEKDFYKLLGVEKTASVDEIKKAYKKAALIHHPDRHSVAEEHVKLFHTKKFKDIGESYGVLSDPAKRALYDQGRLHTSIQAEYPGGPAAAQAAFWASLAAAGRVQQARMQAEAAQLAARLAQQQTGLRPRAGAGAGLAGARPGRGPFLFVPAGPPGRVPLFGVPPQFVRFPSQNQNFGNYRF